VEGLDLIDDELGGLLEQVETTRRDARWCRHFRKDVNCGNHRVETRERERIELPTLIRSRANCDIRDAARPLARPVAVASDDVERDARAAGRASHGGRLFRAENGGGTRVKSRFLNFEARIFNLGEMI